MKFLGSLLRFFIYSNLFIACCALLMTCETAHLFLQGKTSTTFYLFVAFATVCSYSFHWYLTPPGVEAASSRTNWLMKYRWIHAVLFVLSLIAVIYCGFKLISYWPWLLLTAFITFLYSAPKIPWKIFRALRKIAVGKTIFLAMVWMHVTVILPILVSGTTWQSSFTWFAINRFFLIYSICILFDHRDRENDIKAGIKSLVTWIPSTKIIWLFAASIGLFFGSGLMLLSAAFPYETILILLIPGIITAALYHYASTHNNDILYYLILDGLMAFSAIIHLTMSS